MNKRIPLLVTVAVTVVLLFSGCASTNDGGFVKRSNKVQRFTFRTLGEPGQHFTCKLKMDAVEREMSGISPAEFPLEACVLTGTIRKTHGEGTLRFQILVDGSTLGLGNLVEPGDVCRFRYHANGIEVWN